MSNRPSQTRLHRALFSILFHVTCFKLRFLWIIKCSLKASFHTTFLNLIIDVWQAEKTKTCNIFLNQKDMRNIFDNGCLFSKIKDNTKNSECSFKEELQKISVTWIENAVYASTGVKERKFEYNPLRLV